MPAVPVGSKTVNISAAGQSVYSKEDDAISLACADDYYCQEAGEAFLTSDCYDACDDPGIGGLDNCTVVTTVDEYCAECPLGSACDKHGTSLHTVKPYAPTGYYRLDLGGADSDVACVEHREHRPHYCYDFSWCIRGGAAAPALRFMFALVHHAVCKLGSCGRCFGPKAGPRRPLFAAHFLVLWNMARRDHTSQLLGDS